MDGRAGYLGSERASSIHRRGGAAISKCLEMLARLFFLAVGSQVTHVRTSSTSQHDEYPMLFDASRRRKKGLKSSRNKHEHVKARAVVGRGEKSLLSDPESQLRLGRSKQKKKKK